ncbi:MAG TPA: hypothetical protein VNK26_03380 [Pyrinomonadaceae bacterium]|jgi:hypothetical protein|nr:hypothetical protein [Pyrinomonadaceae bacterium]
MPLTAIIIGEALFVLGIAGYAYGLLNGNASLTALIPSVFGLIISLCGILSRSRQNLRKHLMHIAAVVAFVGFIVSGGRLFSKINELTFSAATVSLTLMALLCLIFLIVAINSFISARTGQNQ